MQKVSKGFYLGSIVGAFGISIVLSLIATVITMAGAQQRGSSGQGAAAGFSGLNALALLVALYGGIVGLVLLYKMWSAIQPASTTPGKAVGFLFIPFFNFYWAFRAYWGWAKDYNALRTSRNLQAPAAPEGLALTMCILILCSMIPCLGFLCALVNIVLIAIFFSKGIDGINAIASAPVVAAAAPAEPPPTAGPQV